MENPPFRLLLTPVPLQLSCNLQWPVLLFCGELDYWCPNPALNPHLSGPAAPKKQKSIFLGKHQQNLNVLTCTPLSCKWQINRNDMFCSESHTFPLLTFSEQARRYMGIPMTTSSQAWTAPALHCDMHVFRVSSACWRRSSCSSPSDRLCCVRLSESGLVRRSLWCGIREKFRVRGKWKSKKVTHLETISQPTRKTKSPSCDLLKCTEIIWVLH